MDRRTFLKTSTGAAAASGIGGVVAVSQGGQTAAPRSDAPAVLKGYTAEEHRRRLENIGRYQR